MVILPQVTNNGQNRQLRKKGRKRIFKEKSRED